MNNVRLTIKEMYEKYPDQWLFIIQPYVIPFLNDKLS